MEEMMMMMTMMVRRPGNPRKESIFDELITTSTCPTWKLYENPFYVSPKRHRHPHHHRSQQEQETHSAKRIHRLHLPISARKIAASFWDLTFIRPFMESDFDMARAEIAELKAELEFERKGRKKMEAMNKRLVKELSEERKGKEALERVCEELAREISSDKEEIRRMKKEMEEERKMIRMAEVLREERVHMKLAEARILMEEKLLELEATSAKRMQVDSSGCKIEAKNEKENGLPIKTASTAAAAAGGDVNSTGEPKRSVSVCSSDSNSIVHCLSMPRRASPEPENPHVRRGIKGFVEFPKVLRTIGSKSGHLDTKLECQKAQLRMLLKQKSPVRSNNLIMS